MVFVIALNSFYHRHHISGKVFNEGHTVPVYKKHEGLDFRVVYKQAEALSRGLDSYLEIKNAYPPLVAVLAFPLTKLDETTAYRVYTVVLLCALFLCIFVTLKENFKLFDELNNRALLAISVFLFTLFYNTYPVMFAIERGNCDLMAGFFCALSLYAATKGRMILSIVALTIAIHYKLYPLILIAIVFPRFGWKSIPWFIAGNAAASLILGYRVFKEFISRVDNFSQTPNIWFGNHSIYSFLTNFANIDLHDLNLFLSASLVAIFVLAWCWVHRNDIVRLFGFKRVEVVSEAALTGAEVGLVGMAFQLMSLIPTTSHDYQLVVQIVPIIMVASRTHRDFKLNKYVYFILTVSMMILTAYLFAPRNNLMNGIKTIPLLMNMSIFLVLALSGRNKAVRPALSPRIAYERS
jgi:hypothetical protein